MLSQGLGRFRDSFTLAGWLFADIMVALAVLFFAAEPRHVNILPPIINGFSPAQGKPGTVVTVTGANLRTADSARIGDATAILVGTPSETQLQITVPDTTHTGRISVYVMNEFGTSQDEFVVIEPPTPTQTLTPTPTSTLTPTPTLTATPTVTLTPTITPTPIEIRLEKDCWSYTLQNVTVGPNAVNLTPTPNFTPYEEGTVKDLLQQTFAFAASRKAGFVLTFAQASNQPGDPGGDSLANRMNVLLQRYVPKVFDIAQMRGFLAIGRPVGQVEFNVYFLPGSANVDNGGAGPCETPTPTPR